MSYSSIFVLKNFQISLFVLIALYGIFIAVGAGSDFPVALKTASFMPYLFDKPVGEDGFYMLMVAWNFAQGNGLVGNFDQDVTGIQPLATFIYASLASLVIFFDGDKVDFIRVVILFGTFNFIFFASLMSLLTRRLLGDERCNYTAPFYAAVLSCSSYYIFRLSTYGLETGVYLTCLSLLLLQYANLKDEIEERKIKSVISRNIIVFGVLVGITGLARIDFGVVFAVFFIWSSLKNRSYTIPLTMSGLIGTLIVLPWLIHVYFVTGTPIPSSGTAQASLVSLNDMGARVEAMIYAVIQNFMPTVYIASKSYLLAAAILLLIILIFAGIRQSAFKGKYFLNDWVIPLLVLIPVYFSFFWASHFYTRYTSPLLVLSIPFLALSIPSNIKVKSFMLNEKFITSIAVGVFFTFCVMSLHRGKIGNSHSVTAGYIYNEYPGEVVGAFQSGVVGFVNPNVVNLDGKVNKDILPYVEAGNIDLYLQENQQIKILVDWPGYIATYISESYLESSWEKCIDEASWGSVGYCRKK